jgi:hypothetical protein
LIVVCARHRSCCCCCGCHHSRYRRSCRSSTLTPLPLLPAWLPLQLIPLLPLSSPPSPLPLTPSPQPPLLPPQLLSPLPPLPLLSCHRCRCRCRCLCRCRRRRLRQRRRRRWIGSIVFGAHAGGWRLVATTAAHSLIRTTAASCKHQLHCPQRCFQQPVPVVRLLILIR